MSRPPLALRVARVVLWVPTTAACIASLLVGGGVLAFTSWLYGWNAGESEPFT